MSPLLLLLPLLLLFSPAHSAKRELVTGEIRPVTAEQSATKDDNPEYAAKNAVDLDFGTTAWAVPDSNQKLWLKLTLDQIHCVEKLVYRTGDEGTYQTWNCPSTACTCKGSECSYYTLKVSSVKPLPKNLPSVTDCVYGDTLTYEKTKGDPVIFGTEVPITGKEVLICEVPTISGGEVSPSNAILPGSSYTVTCKSGYTLKGSSDISCSEDSGKATLSTSPTCEKDKDEDKEKLSFANSPKTSALLLLFLTAFLVN